MVFGVSVEGGGGRVGSVVGRSVQGRRFPWDWSGVCAELLQEKNLDKKVRTNKDARGNVALWLTGETLKILGWFLSDVHWQHLEVMVRSPSTR